MPRVEFEPTISAGERPLGQAHILNSMRYSDKFNLLLIYFKSLNSGGTMLRLEDISKMDLK
jgi:hypothetical protein